MSDAVPNKDELLKKALFVPCETQEDLHRWIKIYLGLDLPNCTVDPESNSNPMAALWEVYHKALQNNDPDFSRFLAYSSRDSFKTLSQSIFEVLAMVHLKRDCVHLAAIEAQSLKSQSYCKGFFNRPYLREYVIGDNKRRIEIVRYYHPVTGDSITLDQWKELSESSKLDYKEIKNYNVIIVCTMQSTNGQHSNILSIDELDIVTNPRAYEEAKMVPAPINGLLPITFLTSTRKFSFGLVQKEIDEAKRTGLHIRHWNIIDVTEACPAERHRPEHGNIMIYHNSSTLRSVSEKEYGELPADKQDGFTPGEGYAGCLSNCSLFAMCKGRLATKQSSKSPILKPIYHTINQFKVVPVETAKAQLLCWKPSSEGLIYSRFDRDVHLLSASSIAEKITGEEYPSSLTKQQLVSLMLARGMSFYSGIDWGFEHPFAVVTAAVDGNRAFVFDVVAASGLELSQMVDLCETRIKHLDPVIFPDTAYPGSIKTFKRHGFKMRDWPKAKGSVVAGIEIVRAKLWPTIGEPQMFFLRDDEGCELLAKFMSTYHWKIDTAGRPTDVPEDTDDDLLDAHRYLIMNVFAPKGKLVTAQADPIPSSVSINRTQDPEMARKMQEILGPSDPFSDGTSEPQVTSSGKGRFNWSI